MSKLLSFLRPNSGLVTQYKPNLDYAAIRRRKEFLRRTTAALCCFILAFTTLYIIATSIRSTTVLVTTSSLPAGHRITNRDIRTIRVANSQITTTLVTSPNAVINQFTRIALAKGEPFSVSTLTQEPAVPMGQTVVTLSPSSMPTNLQLGDAIQVLSTSCATEHISNESAYHNSVRRDSLTRLSNRSFNGERSQVPKVMPRIMPNIMPNYVTRIARTHISEVISKMMTRVSPDLVRTVMPIVIRNYSSHNAITPNSAAEAGMSSYNTIAYANDTYSQSCTLIDHAVVHHVLYADDTQLSQQSSGLLNSKSDQPHNTLRIAVSAQQAVALVDAQTRGSALIVARAH